MSCDDVGSVGLGVVVWHKHSSECNKFGWYLKYVEGTLHQAVFASNTELIDAILGRDIP